MDVDVERPVLRIELTLEDFNGELLASDDGTGRTRQSRQDFVLDCRQRQISSVDRHSPSGRFEDHASNRLHERFPPTARRAGGDGPCTTDQAGLAKSSWQSCRPYVVNLSLKDGDSAVATVTQYGTVNISLTSVTGQFVPSTVTIGLGLGTRAAETCSTTSPISTQAGASPQLTGTYNPGVYCVVVRDVGNLFSAARFSITVAYP